MALFLAVATDKRSKKKDDGSVLTSYDVTMDGVVANVSGVDLPLREFVILKGSLRHGQYGYYLTGAQVVQGDIAVSEALE